MRRAGREREEEKKQSLRLSKSGVPSRAKGAFFTPFPLTPDAWRGGSLYFTAVATLLLFVACLPTNLSLDVKEYTAAIVACSGAFFLGVSNAHGIRAVSSTGIYLLLGLLVPRLIAGVLPGKAEIFSAYFMALIVCLGACAILFGLGRLVRFGIAKFTRTP